MVVDHQGQVLHCSTWSQKNTLVFIQILCKTKSQLSVVYLYSFLRVEMVYKVPGFTEAYETEENHLLNLQLHLKNGNC